MCRQVSVSGPDQAVVGQGLDLDGRVTRTPVRSQVLIEWSTDQGWVTAAVARADKKSRFVLPETDASTM